MKLSIIIVNYNTKELLKKCLESIRKSEITKLRNYEIIVVDNGSKEKIKYQIANIKNTLNQSKLGSGQAYKNLKIKLIENKKNVGFAKANNQAIKEAKGEFFLLLNPDTIVSSKTINYMLHFMEEHKNVGVATCKVALPNGELDDACHRGFPTPWNAFCHFSGLGSLFPKSRFFNGYHLGYQEMDKVHEIDACSGAFMMVRQKTGEEIGWFDEDYFWYGEDLDFCYRVKQREWKIMYLPQVNILHYKGVASGIKKISREISTADEKSRRLAQKARFEAMRIFYKKHYKDKYPAFVKWLVVSGIRLIQLATLSF